MAGGAVRLTPEAVPFFRGVADHVTHVTHVNAKIESISELLPQVLSAYLAQISVQQNNDARRITSWAAIMAVPTMIAGVYGRNFTHMPELNEVWGYPMALGFIALSCLLLFALFKRSKWL